jgi:PKD repeat protein
VYAYNEFGTAKDTFQLSDGEVEVNFYNNNAYVDSWVWDFGDSSTDNVKEPIHTYTDIGEYNVQVTVTDGECIKSANRTIYIEEESGIENHNKIGMQIFPNPSSNNFTAKLDRNNYSDTELRILDSSGRLITKIQVFNETAIIPTKGWSPGTYICNLFVDGKLVKVETLIFQK